MKHQQIQNTTHDKFPTDLLKYVFHKDKGRVNKDRTSV